MAFPIGALAGAIAFVLQSGVFAALLLGTVGYGLITGLAAGHAITAFSHLTNAIREESHHFGPGGT